jgi:hypothetical protein
MKKIFVLVLLGLVGWNAFGRPEGAEYFYPAGGDSHKYTFRATTGFYVHAQRGSLSSTWGQHATLTHEETITIDGHSYRKMVLRQNTPGSKHRVTYSRLGKDGIYSRRSDDLTSEEYLELPLPPKIGQKWLYQVEGEHIENEIAAIESVEVGGKTYQKCLRVNSWGTVDGMPAYAVTHYAPLVGMVKFASTVGGQELELALSQE